MITTLMPLVGAVELGGKGMINQLVTLLLIGLCLGVIYGIGWYFFKDEPFGPRAMKIWNGLFVLVVGLAIVNFLLGLAGHQVIPW